MTTAALKERARRNRSKVSNEDLCALAQAGDVAARDQLVEQNLGLCYQLGRKYENQVHSADDLTQRAAIKMLDVIEKFDPQRGAKFCTIAHFAISRYLQHIRKFGGVIAFPPDFKWNQNSAAVKEAKALAGAIGSIESLKRPLGDQHEDSTPELARLEMQRELLECGLMQLSEREQAVIRFSLEGTTLEEIGKAIGVTRERVRQIRERAIWNLRQLLKIETAAQDCAA